MRAHGDQGAEHLDRSAGESSAAPPSSLARHEAVLALQRAVGNQAVRKVLAPTTVQRALTTRASDLDQAFGLGAVGANLGRGTFAAIRRTLASYQRLQNDAAKMDMLQTLSKLISQWMVEHKGGAATDMGRRRMLEQLEQEISTELLTVSKGLADEKYLRNVQDSADPHALKGLTEMTRQDVIGGMGTTSESKPQGESSV